MLDQLFALFLRERRYLKNVSPKTLTWYETAWTTFRRTPGVLSAADAPLTTDDLHAIVVALRDRGVRPVTCNT